MGRQTRKEGKNPTLSINICILLRVPGLPGYLTAFCQLQYHKACAWKFLLCCVCRDELCPHTEVEEKVGVQCLLGTLAGVHLFP